MRGVDITRAIGRVGLKVEPVLGLSLVRFGPKTGPKGHIKKQVHWYFYANEKRVVSGPKHPQRGVKTYSGS